MARLQIEIDVDDKGTVKIRQLGEATRDLGRTTEQAGRTGAAGMGQLTGSLRSLLQVAGGFAAAQLGIQGISGAFSAIKQSVIGTNVTLDQATLKFQILLGSADAARAHVKELFDFAARTPFETGPILDASRQLLAAGVAADKVKEKLTLVGDAAAIAGAPINELAVWYARAYAAIQGGRPFGESAQRLQELAVLTPKTRAVLEDLGKQMEKNGPTAELTAKSLEVLEGEFKRFSGSMALLSTQWEGLTSTIKDNASLAIAEGFRPFFDQIMAGLKLTADFVSGETFRAWMREAGSDAMALSGQLKELGVTAVKTLAISFGQSVTELHAFRAVMASVLTISGGALIIFKSLAVVTQQTILSIRGMVEALLALGRGDVKGALAALQSRGDEILKLGQEWAKTFAQVGEDIQHALNPPTLPGLNEPVSKMRKAVAGLTGDTRALKETAAELADAKATVDRLAPGLSLSGRASSEFSADLMPLNARLADANTLFQDVRVRTQEYSTKLAGLSVSLVDATKQTDGYLASTEDVQRMLSTTEPVLKSLEDRLKGQITLFGDTRVRADAYLITLGSIATTTESVAKSTSTWESAGNAVERMFSGISDILSLFGVKVGKFILLLQNLPRAVGGLREVFAGLGGLLTLGAGTFGLEGTAFAETAKSVSALGNASGETAGILGFFAGTLNVANSLLGAFGESALALGAGFIELLKALALGSFRGSGGGGLSGLTNLLSSAVSGIKKLFGGGGSSGFSGFSGGGPLGLSGSGILSIAAGLTQFAMDLKNGKYGKALLGGAGYVAGSFFGGPVGGVIGQQIGRFIGGVLDKLFGGLFSGPKPQISGRVRVNPTTIDELLAAQQVTAGQVVNPPGRSHFSFLQSGPFLLELFKHRTQGALNRDETQATILNIIISTIQAAVEGLTALTPRLPDSVSRQLSERIDAVLAAGFEVTDFNVKGKKTVKKFQEWLEQLSGATLDAFTQQVFPSIDLAALGADDAVKGFDTLTAALAGFSDLLMRSGHATAFAGDTLDEFATRSVDFFRGFQQEGEALADTITRVTNEVGNLITQLEQFRTSTNQFLLGLQTQISVLSLQSGGGLAEFNLLRQVTPGVIGALPRDLQLQMLGPLVASLVEQGRAAIETNQPLGDILAGRQQLIDFGVSLFGQLQQETDPILAIQGLQTLAAAAQQLLEGEIEAVKIYYGQLIAQEQTRLTALEQERQAIQASTDALEAEIAALQTTAEARLAPLREEQQLLQDQLSILQDQARALQSWQDVVESVRKQLLDMRLTLDNPQNALERLAIARQAVAAAKAAFAIQGTPESARALQGALSAELQIAQEAFHRPSTAYQQIFDQVSADLQAIQSVAESNAGDLESLTRQIADKSTRLTALTEQIQAIERETANAVRPLEASLQALRATNDARLAQIQGEEVQLRATIQERITALQQEQAALITQLRQETVGGLQAIRNEAFVRLEQAIREGNAQIAGLLGVPQPPTTDPLIAQGSAALMALAQLAQGGGLTDLATALATSSHLVASGRVQESILSSMQALSIAQMSPALMNPTGQEAISRFAGIIDAARISDFDRALSGLNDLLTFLHNAGITATAPVPGFQHGLDYVPHDNFLTKLHRGERVLTASENAALTRSMFGEGANQPQRAPVTINIAFNYTGSARKDEWDRFMETVNYEAQFGKLAKIISERAKRA